MYLTLLSKLKKERVYKEALSTNIAHLLPVLILIKNNTFIVTLYGRGKGLNYV